MTSYLSTRLAWIDVRRKRHYHEFPQKGVEYHTTVIKAGIRFKKMLTAPRARNQQPYCFHSHFYLLTSIQDHFIPKKYKRKRNT